MAGGFRIPHQTARDVSLSGASVAGVNDPSAVFYNPAALYEIDGNKILGSGQYINVLGSVENSGRKSINKRDDNFLPTLFANYHIPGSDFTVGLGTYSPFGLATSYDPGFSRFAAEVTELRTLNVTPALSWHPAKVISVGAGLSFVHSSAVLSRALCFDLIAGCVNPGGADEGRIRVTGVTNAFTYNVGVLVKPTNALKLAGNYRARTDLRFDKSDVKFGGNFTLAKTKATIRPIPLPPVTDVGAFWQINSSWGVEFKYEFTRWSEFKSVSAIFSPESTFTLTGLGVPIPVSVNSFSLPQKWKDTNGLALGSSYKVNKQWELRGGVGIEQSPIPNTAVSPAIPDSDNLTLSTGVSYTLNNISIDLGYMAVFYKSRKVNNLELEGSTATGIRFVGAPGADKHKTFIIDSRISNGYSFRNHLCYGACDPMEPLDS
jgi:long-chain fatty acid transport protein